MGRPVLWARRIVRRVPVHKNDAVQCLMRRYRQRPGTLNVEHLLGTHSFGAVRRRPNATRCADIPKHLHVGMAHISTCGKPGNGVLSASRLGSDVILLLGIFFALE